MEGCGQMWWPETWEASLRLGAKITGLAWTYVEPRGVVWERLDMHESCGRVDKSWTCIVTLTWPPTTCACGRPKLWARLDVHVRPLWPSVSSCAWSPRSCGHGHTKWARPHWCAHARAWERPFLRLLAHETFHAPASLHAPSFSKFSSLKCLTFWPMYIYCLCRRQGEQDQRQTATREL